MPKLKVVMLCHFSNELVRKHLKYGSGILESVVRRILHKPLVQADFAQWNTNAIKENLIPPDLTPEQISYKYANEADLLNVALFGKTAKQWRDENPGKKGNIRDEADLKQLLVLANMESYNAILIEQGKLMSERLILLRDLAVRQMRTLASVSTASLPLLQQGDTK